MLTTNTIFDDPQKVYDYIYMFKLLSPKKVIFISESSRDGFVLEELWRTLPEVTLIYAKGKLVCLDSASLAYKNGLKGCAALVDSDFDNIKQNTYNFPVVLTDYHDIEGYAIFSESWERTLREFLNIDKLSKKDNLSLIELRKKCVELSLPLGVALFSNNEFMLSIDFTNYCFGKKCKIDYQKYINSAENVIERLKNLNSKLLINWQDFLDEVNKKIKTIFPQDENQYISSIMICKCLIELSKEKGLFRAEFSANTFSELHLLRWFRSHLRKEDLVQTNMWNKAKEFIEENQK